MTRSMLLAIRFGAAWCSCTLPAAAAISMQIPAECGSASEVEGELEQRLGNAAATDTTRVTLTPELAGYRLVVEAANQRRELHDSDCRELLRAAIVISLALLEPERAEAPPPASPELAPPAQSRAKPVSQAGPRLALGAAGGLHFGTLPQATLLLDFDAHLQWQYFGVAAGFRYLLPTETRDASGRGARVGAAGAYLAGVFEPGHGLQTRLGIVTYRLSGTGLGSVAVKDGVSWEVAPIVATSFTPFERPPFWTNVGVEGQLNLFQPKFEILSYHEVFRVPRLSGTAFARAGVVF